MIGTSADFFNNFVVESVDPNGRTSMRQVEVGSGNKARASTLKFVRKSDLSQTLYSNKSVISIKGGANDEAAKVSIKYGVNVA